ncbi:MAG: hypothetical protein L0196_03385 [candidate division Zixibacteria bacterium]|nr:hypothetical protein [candidate division Zixibacteria bacterium]
MNKVLEDLKAVPGVSGVLLLNKTEETTYQLLPASFSIETIKSVAIRLLQVSYYLKPDARFKLAFASGSVILQNLEKAALLVFIKGAIDEPIFELVMKNSVKSLERWMERYEVVREKLSGEALMEEEEALEMFLRTANLVSAHFKQSLGGHQVTQNWRKSRENLAGDYPFHYRLFVETGGKLSFKPSEEKISVPSLTDFFAGLIHQFLKLSVREGGKEAPMEKLTSELRSSLEKTSFYRTLALLEKRPV